MNVDLNTFVPNVLYEIMQELTKNNWKKIKPEWFQHIDLSDPLNINASYKRYSSEHIDFQLLIQTAILKGLGSSFKSPF